MRAIAIALWLVVWTMTANADAPDYVHMSDEQLVDALQGTKDETVGIDSQAMAMAFLAEDKPPKFVGGVLGTRQPVISEPMRQLVRRGINALPVLLRHLDDARPTHLIVPSPEHIPMWSQMGEEYVSRAEDPGRFKYIPNAPPAKLPYTVKVGDVCFVLIGQIVGRPYNTIRYQPSAGMIINSPVESPALAQKVRSDWTNLSESDLREQLLKDAQKVENPFYFGYPFQRLRYYFPEEYAKQKASGPLSTKIEEFEKDEKRP